MSRDDPGRSKNGPDPSSADGGAKSVKGDILAPGQGYPARSLPVAAGVFHTLFWQSVRFTSLRKAIEIYEKAVRAAAASERAEGDLEDARLEHARAVGRLRERGTVLKADADQRERARELATLRDEFEEADLALRIALKREALDNIEKDTPPATEPEEDDLAAELGKIDDLFERISFLRRKIAERVEKIKSQGLNPDEENLLVEQLLSLGELLEDRIIADKI